MSEVLTDIQGGQPARRRRVLPEGVFGWMLVGPAMLFIAVIVAWPLAETIRLSFMDAGLGGEEYVGLANYQDLLDSRKFHQTVVRTFYWMFLAVGV
jgi:multiple sugar transport system permease protein